MREERERAEQLLLSKQLEYEAQKKELEDKLEEEEATRAPIRDDD